MKKKLVHDGYLKIHTIDDVNKNGIDIKREVMSRTKSEDDYSVAGTLYDTDKGVFYLVSQYRAGAKENHRYLLEVAAGTVEQGEDPKECFIRETMEEVGFEVSDIRLSGSYYTSPGGTSEKIFLYHAHGTKVADGGGLTEENEDIEIWSYTPEEIIAMLQNQQFLDIKTQLLMTEIYMGMLSNHTTNRLEV